jgi:hypothetical protein
MRKRKKLQQQERVMFDRTPARDKLTLDLDCAIATGSEHGLTSADIIEQLLLRADQTAFLAKERGEDLSRLNALLFGEVKADENDGVIQ